jgi:MFS transporter, FHS family, L-fucose permease
MAMAPLGSSSLQSDNAAKGGNVRGVLLLVFAVFFILGGVTNIIDVIMPKLKGLFELSHFQANWINGAFFAAYGLFAIPSGIIMSKLGYIRGFVLGFAMIAVAALLFIPAANSGMFVSFLGCMFLIGSGITLLQVGMNPVTMALGKPESAHQRLMFGQMFNSVGVVIMVFGGATLLLGDQKAVDTSAMTAEQLTLHRIADSQEIATFYIALAIAMMLIGLLFWFWRSALDGQKAEQVETAGTLDLLLSNRRVQFGALCIFTYVGAEVAIGSNLISYLGDPRTMGLAPSEAKNYVTAYWSAALIGRLLGVFILVYVKPSRLLMVMASVAALLVILSAVSTGVTSGLTLVAVGLFNSVMFPTIFSLTTEGMTEDAPKASGILCTAIIGGAFIPMLFGKMADLSGVQAALIVPIICYVIIASFGLWTAKRAS